MNTKNNYQKLIFSFTALLLSILVYSQPPRVYSIENTGSGCPVPNLPPLAQLSVIDPLPDPFMKSDNSSRSTRFQDWTCRRNEIKNEIEFYEIGIKPPKPDTISATYTPPATQGGNGTLRVNVTRGGITITLTSQVSLPVGIGPFPAVIGMNSLSGSVPATVFTNRNIARIQYNHNNVTTYNNPSLNDPFYRLYPEYNLVNHGQYAAWAWGVSRLIDGLELVQATLPINLSRIGVTGCSYAGKMALFSGALDERIALTIAQESGGGGAPAWRVSETLGGVEKLGATDYRWFRDSMRNFQGANVNRLPHDHHELMAMIAPRALLVTANENFEWLANPACYVSARAALEVWKTFGVEDRFGFTVTAGHNHCAVPATLVPAIQAFVDKFLGGDNSVVTDTVRIHNYPQIDYKRWYSWWGKTTTPTFDPNPGERVWLETECSNVGSEWSVLNENITDSRGIRSVVVKSGKSSANNAPLADSSYVTALFPINSNANYNVYGRVEVPANEDYEYWWRVNGGVFTKCNSFINLANTTFDNGIVGWNIINNQNAAIVSGTSVSGEFRTGSGALKIVNPISSNQLNVRVSSISLPTVMGKEYEFVFWVKSATDNGSISLSTGPNEFKYQPIQNTTTNWTKITWKIRAFLDTTTFQFNVGAIANTYFIDDISLREVNDAAGWQWVKLGNVNLVKGQNSISLAYANGGATKLDKLLLSTSAVSISNEGLLGSNCTIAPLTIVNLNGNINTNNKVDLLWNTTTETLLNNYTVEKSVDGGSTFYSVGIVIAQNGNANNYTFTDTSNINISRYQYYRLKIIDQYGQYFYSNIVKIDPVSPVELRVYPNPVSDAFILQHDKAASDAQIAIGTVHGITLKLVKPTINAVQTRIEASTLLAGVYTIKFINNGIVYITRFTKK